MEGSLAEVREFAEAWHRESWSITRLPETIGARLFYKPGGGRILGLSYSNNDSKAIVINEDIIGTELFVPTLAHECGHIMLKHKRPHPCIRLTQQVGSEYRAWQAAALLAIPALVVAQIITGNQLPVEIAMDYHVPLPFVSLAFAMLEPDHDEPIGHVAQIAQSRKLVQWLADLTNDAAEAPAPLPGTQPKIAGWPSSAVAQGFDLPNILKDDRPHRSRGGETPARPKPSAGSSRSGGTMRRGG